MLVLVSYTIRTYGDKLSFMEKELDAEIIEKIIYVILKD